MHGYLSDWMGGLQSPCPRSCQINEIQLDEIVILPCPTWHLENALFHATQTCVHSVFLTIACLTF